MDAKKIGIDVRLWNETGIGRYIRNLVENLIRTDSGHEYILFACSKDFNDIKRLILKSENFQIIKADIHWHSASEQIEFPSLLNKYNLDLMHFPYFSVPVMYKKPFVVTVHDLIINNFSTGRATTLPRPIYFVKKIGYSYVLKSAIKNSRKILAPSLATKQEILSHYSVPAQKIEVTPEGIDKTILDFKPNIFSEKHPYFLYVGNAYPHKNVERLIEAFLIFSEKHPEYKLRLVGKKDFFYERLIHKIHNSKIEFMGYVTDMDLAKLYKNSEATIAPSLMEGFGLTVLEALSLGSIVACSAIPSLQEVAGESAIYFDPEDVLTLTSAMETVAGMNKGTRDERISAGLTRAGKFSWEKMTKETIDVYESCL